MGILCSARHWQDESRSGRLGLVGCERPGLPFFHRATRRAPDAPLPVLNRFDSSTAANSAPAEGCAVGTEYPKAAFVTLAQNFLAVACSLKTRRLTADRVS